MLDLTGAHNWDSVSDVWPRRVVEDPAIVPFVLTGDNLLAYGRLRYELFVERDGKAYPHADHRNRVLIEPVDQWSLNFGAVTDGQCLIGVRLTRAQDAQLDEQLLAVRTCYEELPTARTVINSRLASYPAGHALLPALFRQVFRAVVLSGARYGLVSAREAVAPLFERFGYRRSTLQIDDRIAGPLIPLMLDGDDLDHMRNVRSPYLKPFLELHKRTQEEAAE